MEQKTNRLRGIRRVNLRFEARIAIDGKRRSLGFFDTEVEARAAYDEAKSLYWDQKPIPYSERDEPPTAERVREVLDYCPLTGIFTRKARPGVVSGAIAGTLKPDGYRQVRVDGRKYYANQLAWLHHYGEWPKFQVDHKDGNRDYNAINNLRLATRAENLQNTAARRKSGTGLIGSTWNHIHKKYQSRIMINRKSHHLGLFATAEEAHKAYLAAKERLHTFQPIPRDLD